MAIVSVVAVAVLASVVAIRTLLSWFGLRDRDAVTSGGPGRPSLSSRP